MAPEQGLRIARDALETIRTLAAMVEDHNIVKVANDALIATYKVDSLSFVERLKESLSKVTGEVR